MTLSEIEAFLAAAEAGTITGAAERLFLSQSTLSGRIAALEMELGTCLLKRGKGQRAMELTEQGRQFLPVAEQWKQLWRETAAIGAGHRRELRSSAVHSVNLYVLPSVYREFARRQPEVRLWLRIRHSLDSYALVESGDVESALVTRRRYSRRVETVPLWKENLVFVCGPACPCGESPHPSELDVAHELLMDWNEEFLGWQQYWFGDGRQPRLFTDDMDLLAQFLQDPDVWALIPRSVANALSGRNGLQLHSLRDGPQDRVVYLLTRTGAAHTPELTCFLQLLKEAVTSQGAEWLAD